MPEHLSDDHQTPVKQADVSAQLNRILRSAGFRNSQRLCRFLEFTVRGVLSGSADHIKESVLGRDVFDRGSRFDPRTDSIVRVESQRLRRKLKDYYANDGREDPVSITFRPGSYVPGIAYAPREGQSTVPRQAEEPSAPIPDPRIVAVLPLTNQSSDPEQEFFCDGLTEEIIYSLSRIPGLMVIGRTSVFALKGTRQDARAVGIRLGAGTIVSGSVRKSGGQLRIVVDMVNAQTGELRWAGVFDRVAGEDVFAIEEEIALSIARASQMALAPDLSRRSISGAPNMNAYLHYLRARYEWNRMSIAAYHRSIELFEEAISLFPSYAALYAGIADAHIYLALWGGSSPREAFPKAEKAAREALRLDASLPHAYSTLAAAEAFYGWNWAEGVNLARKAAEMEPSYAFGQHIFGACLLASGNLEEAQACFERTVTLDPLSLRAHRTLGWSMYLQRRFSDAVKWLKGALILDPRSEHTRYLLSHVYLRQGEFAAALEEARLCQTDPPDPLSVGLLGACFGYMGRKREAAAILAKLSAMAGSGYVDPHAQGQVLISLGNFDLANEAVNLSLIERAPFAAFFKFDPEFDPLRGTPRFIELIAKLGQ